ncbi:MAG: hypothetical protein WDN23_10390 [Edaphobacter sp.]
MPTYCPEVSKEILDHIGVAETMHNFVLANVPDKLLLDTDQKVIIVALFSLAIEHHGAMLYLLRSGRFDGSAFALARPLVDAVYRAFWVHLCAKPKHLEAIRKGEFQYPPFPNMADEVEKRMSYTDGLFTKIKPFITALHGYTHGGLEQLGRRFDDQGNVRAAYRDGEKTEVISASTSYLVMLAVAWCQIVEGGQPDQEPRSATIMACYNELFGKPPVAATT